jgi:Asp-tRNA(Asn)/Glu-tRNA(Gln) amidotransferase A subunit family amidase
MDNPPRIGLIRGFFLEESDAKVRKHTEDAAEELARAGAVVEEVDPPPSFAIAHHVQWVVNHTETAAYHEENFRKRADDYSASLRKRIEVGILTPAVRYVQAQRLRRVFRREMEALASKWDVLLTPTTPTAAPRDLSTTGDPVFQSPWTSCGLPTITLPSGLSPSTGLPLGIQLAASPFAEVRLGT